MEQLVALIHVIVIMDSVTAKGMSLVYNVISVKLDSQHLMGLIQMAVQLANVMRKDLLVVIHLVFASVKMALQEMAVISV